MNIDGRPVTRRTTSGIVFPNITAIGWQHEQGPRLSYRERM